MNRGSAQHGYAAIGIASCFNEAPIHESGKSTCPGTSGSRSITCFNEAPIHDSGKFSPPSSPARPKSGFNEAPIHESGKCFAARLARPSRMLLQ